MKPADFVKPTVNSNKLYLDLNKNFRNYEGEAGLIISMPEGSLEEISLSVGGVATIHEDVVDGEDQFHITGSTDAVFYMKNFRGDDIEFKMSTGAMATVAVDPDADDVDATLTDVSTGTALFLEGIHKIDIDNMSNGAYLQATGDKLEEVDADNVSTGATLYAEFSSDDDDTKVYIKDISTGARAILSNLDDIDVKNAFAATFVVDDESLCASVSSFFTSECRYVPNLSENKSYRPQSLPKAPKSVLLDVDYSGDYCKYIPY